MRSPGRLVALLGGDWYDASVDHLLIPDGMDLKKEMEAWKEWVQKVYGQPGSDVPYIFFPDWLVQHGAQKATSEEVEVVSQDEL